MAVKRKVRRLKWRGNTVTLTAPIGDFPSSLQEEINLAGQREFFLTRNAGRDTEERKARYKPDYYS